MEYPTYLIHYGIPGQKWGVRRYQNEDGTYTEEGKERRREEFIEETRKTANKVAGIIAGHYGNKDLSPSEMKKLINKYKNFEYIDEYAEKHPDEYKEFMKKVNKNDGFNKSHDKLYEWKDFEDHIVKNPSDLYKEKAIRKDRLQDVFKLTDEEAETKLEDINKKIRNYNDAIETYLNTSTLKKNMKELNVELKDIYDKEKHITEDYTPDETQKILGFRYTKPKKEDLERGIARSKNLAIAYENENKRKRRLNNNDDVERRLEDFRRKYRY